MPRSPSSTGYGREDGEDPPHTHRVLRIPLRQGVYARPGIERRIRIQRSWQIHPALVHHQHPVLQDEREVSGDQEVRLREAGGGDVRRRQKDDREGREEVHRMRRRRMRDQRQGIHLHLLHAAGRPPQHRRPREGGHPEPFPDDTRRKRPPQGIQGPEGGEDVVRPRRTPEREVQDVRAHQKVQRGQGRGAPPADAGGWGCILQLPRGEGEDAVGGDREGQGGDGGL